MKTVKIPPRGRAPRREINRVKRAGRVNRDQEEFDRGHIDGFENDAVVRGRKNCKAFDDSRAQTVVFFKKMMVVAVTQFGCSEIAAWLIRCRSRERGRALEQRFPCLIGDRPIARVCQGGNRANPVEQTVNIRRGIKSEAAAAKMRRRVGRTMRVMIQRLAFSIAATQPQPGHRQGIAETRQRRRARGTTCTPSSPI